jgi:hypothetical protein
MTAVIPPYWEFDGAEGATLGDTWLLLDNNDLASVEFYRPFPIHTSRAHNRAPFPADFIGFLRHHPRLRAARPIAVRIGGVRGTLLDVTATSNDPEGQAESLCGTPSWNEPCLPISHDPDAEGFVSVALWRGLRARFIYLRTRSWQLVVVVRRPRNPRMDREVRPIFNRILNSTRFG